MSLFRSRAWWATWLPVAALTVATFLLTRDLGPFDDDDAEWSGVTQAISQGERPHVRFPASFGTVTSPIPAYFNAAAYRLFHSIEGMYSTILVSRLIAVSYLLALGFMVTLPIPLTIAALLFLLSSGLLIFNPIRACPEPFVPMAIAAVLFHFVRFSLKQRSQDLVLTFLFVALAIHMSLVTIPILPALCLALLSLRVDLTPRRVLVAAVVGLSPLGWFLWALPDQKHKLLGASLAIALLGGTALFGLPQSRRAALGERLQLSLPGAFIAALILGRGSLSSYFFRLSSLFHVEPEIWSHGAGVALGVCILLVVCLILSKRDSLLRLLFPFLMVPLLATACLWAKAAWMPIHWLLSLTPSAFIFFALATRPRLAIAAIALSTFLYGQTLARLDSPTRPFFLPLRAKLSVLKRLDSNELRPSWAAAIREPQRIPNDLNGWRLLVRDFAHNENHAPIYLCDQRQLKCPGGGFSFSPGILAYARHPGGGGGGGGGSGFIWHRVR
ncbi:MAG: hypothetical protein HYR96_01135 [Deltaproteobacteria bacterium]|nr:hypothetical protein [Deltaproteobacteria bacterium]MBI3296473.1 hypothetical protein [Deltaproteobacteria bacterium]